MFSGFTFLFIDDDDDAFLFLPNNKPIILVSSRARSARVLSLSLLFASHSSKRGRGFARFLFLFRVLFCNPKQILFKRKKKEAGGWCRS